MILDAVSQSKVVIARGGDVTILDESKMEMAIESFLHFTDVFHLCDSAHGDLLTLVNITHWATHFDENYKLL